MAFTSYLILLVEITLLLVLEIGGGLLLGVFVRLLNGELAGLGLEVTSIRKSPLT